MNAFEAWQAVPPVQRGAVIITLIRRSRETLSDLGDYDEIGKLVPDLAVQVERARATANAFILAAQILSSMSEVENEQG